MRRSANQPVNAVIYARYSSHSQTEQSIEGQLHDAYEFAAREGYTIIGEYIDRAISGRSDDRPDFQRMIADAPKKQFSVVIVWKLDRFARNRYDSAINKAKLKKYGMRVVSVKENITDSPEGIILEGLLESMAEYYSANLSVNIKRGQRETIAKGRYCGGTIPYGYKAIDGKLVEDEKTAWVIRFVFDQYAQGVPMKEIVETLRQRGVKGRRGGPLGYGSFADALKNPAYIGQFTYNGQIVPDVSQRLIEDDTFYKVQERLKATARAPAAQKAKVEYLLQGKAFCGHCGASMVGESGKGRSGSRYYYYSCADRKKHHTCKKSNEKKDFVEWYVVEQTAEFVLTPIRTEAIAKAVVEEYKKEFGGDKTAELEKAVRRIDKELDALVDAIPDTSKSARPRIYSKMESLEAQKADLEIDIAKLRIAQGIQLTEEEVRAWLRQFCKGDPLDEEFRKRIIDVFINSVYLYDNRVIVFYSIKGGKQISYIDLIESDAAAEYNVSDLNRSAPPARKTLVNQGFFYVLIRFDSIVMALFYPLF